MFETMTGASLDSRVEEVTDLDLEFGVDFRWGRHLS
jgi:hypothetical protein